MAAARHRQDELRSAFRRLRIATATDLRATLGVSQPTLSRLLGELRAEVVTLARGRRTRYALARSVRGFPNALPLYRVNADGRGEHLGQLRPLTPEGFALQDFPGQSWPLPGDMADGAFPGLPYFLFDARPQGFLGRAFAKRRATELQVSDDPTRWSDDDIVVVMAVAGEDLPGDLVLGDASYERLLARMSEPKPGLTDAEVPAAYPRLAAEALAGGAAWSSAGGEFPKFTATRRTADRFREVIVKFSGPDDTAAGQRWSDLLVAESLAAATIAGTLGEAARCQLFRFGGRAFLEVERYDRVGAWGRKPVCTLSAIEAALLGLRDARWDRAASALFGAGLIAPAARERIVTLWCFGNLIANADMHAGNLAFLPAAGKLEIAPAYDMLPMLYAPARGGEVPTPEFKPRLPLPGTEPAWRRAAEAAMRLWGVCATHEAISRDFREIARRNADRLDASRARLT